MNKKTVDKISIPSGAIKRLIDTISGSAVDIFQFLLVRLKVLLRLKECSGNFLFQFLLVRLKDSDGRPDDSDKSGFQFLLVRLKEPSKKELFTD